MNYSEFHNRLSKRNTETPLKLTFNFTFMLIALGLVWLSLIEGVNLFEIFQI